MWKKYLPSKKVVAIFIIPIISIVVIFILNFIIKNNKIKNNNLNLEKKLNEVIDTDGDGLEDWEEDLAGTDKTKKDTDGDGFSDNLEIRTGSDPLDPLNKKKKKRDLEIKAKLENYEYDYRLDPNLNNTDRLAYQFLEEGVKLKKAGLSFNKETQKQVANKIIRSNTINLDLNKYTLSNLNISDSYDVNQFNKKLKGILGDLKKSKANDEMLLLNIYLETKKKEYLSEIKSNIDLYKKTLDKLLKLKVPEVVKNEYLNFINSFNLYTNLISYYSTVDKDPVSSAQALSIYKEVDRRLKDSVIQLSRKINY